MSYNSYKQSFAFKSVAGSGYSTGSAVPSPLVPLTMACWSTSVTGGARGIMAFCTNASTNQRMGIGINASNATTALSRTTGTSTSTAGVGLDNIFTHRAGVWASTSSRIAYTNGIAGAEETTARAVTSDKFVLGADHDTATIINSEIFWPAIWNEALSAAEIAMLASGVSPLLIRRHALIQFWEFTGAPVEYGINPTYALTTQNRISSLTPHHSNAPKYRKRFYGAAIVAAGGADTRRFIIS